MVYTNVGWVSQFYDAHYVWFSQSDLQKGPILPKNKKNSYIGQRYQRFKKLN
jgi:hypothetical protein